MQNTRHLILTRFNVASPGRQEAIRLRPSWLEKRFALFEEFCLPGVRSQTVQDFEWIIFFDQETPDAFREKINLLRGIYDFQPQFTSMFEMKKICRELLAGENSGAEWLLTTRLDSDDVLAADFVETMRAQLSYRGKQVINLANGLILSLEDGKKRLYLDRDEANPFASLLEPFDDGIETIWGRQHREIAEMANVVQVEGEPRWLQVVHGDNVTNRIRGKRVPVADHAARFHYLRGLAERQQEERREIEAENLLLTPLRRAKEVVRALAKRCLGRK